VYNESNPDLVSAVSNKVALEEFAIMLFKVFVLVLVEGTLLLTQLVKTMNEHADKQNNRIILPEILAFIIYYLK
jgi:hypothetical protein